MAHHLLRAVLALLLLACMSHAALPEFKDVPDSPKDLKGEWTERDGAKVIRLTWSTVGKAPASYRLLVDRKSLGRLEAPTAIEVAQPGEYVFVPSDAKVRTYCFALEPVNEEGTAGTPARFVCLAPGRTVYPAVIQTAEQSPASDGRRVELWWKPVLAEAKVRGFRLYMDDTLLADEKTLDAETKTYTTDVLTGSGVRMFSIEVVGENGDVSERSASKRYRLP